jgi:lipopolysaccharide export system permease protein
VERDRETVTSARSGRVDTVGDAQFLMLSNGQRLETSLKGEGLRISEFETHGSRVRDDSFMGGNESPSKARSTLALLREPSPPNQAELAWRVGLALAAINFVLLAVTVSSVNPRVGRSGNLVFALFSFVVYFNLLNLGQSWIGRERTSFAAFVLLLHGGTFAFAALWLAKQHNNWGVKRLLKRLKGPQA